MVTAIQAEIPFRGPGARRLWRAQTKAYAAQNLVRASVAVYRDPGVTTLG